MSFELCYWVYLATVSGTVLSASFKKQDLFLSHEYSNFSHFVEINEHHADRTQGIISAINYMSDESYPIVMVDNRRPQKYTNLIAFFFSFPYDASSDGDLQWNISCKPLGFGK